MKKYDRRGFSSIGQLIETRQAELGITDQQITDALGYHQVNVIGLIKTGVMRMPAEKVVELAFVLDLDEGELLHIILGESLPALLRVIERVMGPIVMSPGEIKLIQAVRKNAKGRDVVPITFDRDSVVALVVA